MKKIITILGGELLSALGGQEERIEHLRKGSYRADSKTITLNDEVLTFPYYGIEGKTYVEDVNIIFSYLQDTVAKAIARFGLDQGDLSRCGLFLGCSSNDFSLSIPLGKNFDHSMEASQACRRIGSGEYADFLQHTFGLSHLNFTYNTACTSSANALMDAATMLEGSMIDYAIVVGFELFAPVTFEGFISMQLLEKDTVRPFDRDRSGIVLGEAISAVVLSRSDIQDAPWHYLGGISNCETHSVTGASPDGINIGEAIAEALQGAGVSSDEITAIKTHGTASELNDIAEANGMKSVFEELPPFFSLKPYIGHTLGACGCSELLLLMESVDNGFLPSSPNFITRDDALGVAPLRHAIPVKQGIFLLNYFGFGGNNTSFVVKKRKA